MKGLRFLARIFSVVVLCLAALSLYEFVTVVISDVRKSGFSLPNFFSWFTTLMFIGVIAWGGFYFWKLGRRPPP